MKAFRKITISAILVFSLIVSPMTYAAETTKDSYGEILADNQLITGYKGDLMESKNISRVEMIAIISKLYASEFKTYVPPTVATFKDVETTHWGYKYVEFAFKKGITAGKSANMFGASDTVNYNQVSIFLIKALGFDLSGIKYTTAASQIEAAFGLNLLLPTDNTQVLMRSSVFELIVKALLMEDHSGVLGIEMLTEDALQIETFIVRSTAVINTPVAIYIGDNYFNIFYANGDLYTGEFDGSSPNGNGILKLEDGKLYMGQFVKGVFSGHGILIWPEGDYYEGEWTNDRYNGLGTYAYLDGSYQYGEWVDDSLVKAIKEVTPEQIKAGTVVASDTLRIEIVGKDGLPLKGIAMTVLDETNDVSYNKITDEQGAMEIPKVGAFSIISMTLGDNSAYQFSLSNDHYMVTTVGLYKNNVTFEIYK